MWDWVVITLLIQPSNNWKYKLVMSKQNKKKNLRMRREWNK